MNFDDPEGYGKLKTVLESIDQKQGTKGNRLFYLATAPEYFADIIEQLGAPWNGEAREGQGAHHHREALRP